MNKVLKCLLVLFFLSIFSLGIFSLGVFAPLDLLAQSQITAPTSTLLSKALQARHSNLSRDKAIELSGSEDGAITELLSLRFSDVPGVSYKAQKLLLNFSENEKVLSALKEDIDESSRQGLARITMANIDLLESSSSRLSIARVVIGSDVSGENASSAESTGSLPSGARQLNGPEDAIAENSEQANSPSFKNELLNILLESTDLDVVEVAKSGLKTN